MSDGNVPVCVNVLVNVGRAVIAVGGSVGVWDGVTRVSVRMGVVDMVGGGLFGLAGGVIGGVDSGVFIGFPGPAVIVKSACALEGKMESFTENKMPTNDEMHNNPKNEVMLFRRLCFSIECDG